MTVEQYQNLCSKEVKRNHLKLYRAKLTYVPSPVPPEQRPVPVDPYFLGLWLGDGTAVSTSISSSDREIAVWLNSYVERLNRGRPLGARPLALHEHLTSRAGDIIQEGQPYTSNADVYEYSITCPHQADGYYWNPVRNGLRDLGLLGNKSPGIPPAYMQADEDTRLAVIAGLIESDGCYVKSHRTYRFIQMTEEHKKIVYDLKDLALSCGISVTGVDENLGNLGFGRHGAEVPVWVCYLGKGSVKFQHHLLLPRKRMTFERKYYTHDLRPLQVANIPDGEYRAIEVSGGKYQLQNRLVVENCHCNTILIYSISFLQC